MSVSVTDLYSLNFPHYHTKLSYYLREMWSLFNMNDSESLTLYDLERGVATVTQTEEFFDCLPAARDAFDYAKVFSNKGVDEEEERKKKMEQDGDKNPYDIEANNALTRKIERTLEFEEFIILYSIFHVFRDYFNPTFNFLLSE